MLKIGCWDLLVGHFIMCFWLWCQTGIVSKKFYATIQSILENTSLKKALLISSLNCQNYFFYFHFDPTLVRKSLWLSTELWNYIIFTGLSLFLFRICSQYVYWIIIRFDVYINRYIVYFNAYVFFLGSYWKACQWHF